MSQRPPHPRQLTGSLAAERVSASPPSAQGEETPARSATAGIEAARNRGPGVIPRLGFFAACAAATLLSSPARADIEFVGVLVTSRGTWLALGDTTTGKTDWIARGEQFAGHTLKAYDAKADIVTLVRDGTEFQLHLKDDAKIKSARLELTGAITFGGSEQIEVQRATLLFDQENIFPLKDGVTYRITPTRLADGNVSYRVAVERAIAENKMETVAAPGVIARPGQTFAVRIAPDYGFRFSPR